MNTPGASDPGPAEAAEHRPGRHGLGPHVVGLRVVVRHLLPGRRGPSGGPALTDVLGTCEAWEESSGGACVIRREDGEVRRVPIADIVSGKPVPPRASVRDRVPPQAVHRRAGALFPDAVDTPLADSADWWTRLDPSSASTSPRRARTVLALTPPDRPGLVAAAAHAVPAPHGPRVTVVADSAEEELFRSAGWTPEEADEPPVLVQVASLATLARALRDAPRHDDVVVEEHSPTAAVARVAAAASGRGGLAEDWLVVGGLHVAPAERRRGLARAILAELVDWAGAAGAHTVHLQVRADNDPAVALYERLGFRTHHVYRYLVPGVPGVPGPG
ncbi:GNAT family N-acetyltransferase [Nocardioides sp.]|uniref:GNAT family N-acetyltransferase n=1 Tax=Nocardioides sp. TaxID=35761 RepID=UPI003510F51F